MTPAEIIAAEVASRYGVTVCASVVQHCPPQTFSASTPIWCGKTRTLVYPDAAAQRDAYKRAMWAGAKRARASAVTPAIIERRAAVARLHSDGLHNAAIMAALGATYSTVRKDLAAQNLQPNAATYNSTMMDRAMALAIQCKVHFDQGKTATQIAAILKIKDDRVRSLLMVKYSLRFARRVKQPKRPTSTRREISNTQARHNTLAGFMADGTDPVTWAVLCGVRPDCIRKDLRKMGAPRSVILRVKIPSRVAQNAYQEREIQIVARQALVRAMTAQGIGPRAIGDALGCTSRTVAKDKLDMGLTGVAA